MRKKLLIGMFVCIVCILLGTLGLCFEATLFLAPFLGTLIGLGAVGTFVTAMLAGFADN